MFNERNWLGNRGKKQQDLLSYVENREISVTWQNYIQVEAWNNEGSQQKMFSVLNFSEKAKFLILLVIEVQEDFEAAKDKVV